MPFQIVRNDITAMAVDAIVNSANPRPVIGLGTDSAIHEKAGPGLLEARKKIGPIAVGHSAITPAFDLQAKYVIHTVGPGWRGGLWGEGNKLRRCYDSALALAAEYGCQSIAFPMISTNNYGFPKDKALQIAISAFSTFLMDHEMTIYLVVFDRESFKLSEKLFRGVSSYIDENYVEAWEKAVYGPAGNTPQQKYRRNLEMEAFESASLPCAPCPSAPQPRMCAAAPAETFDLNKLLTQTDAGFSETLLKLIDRTGKKDSEIYTRANVSRQHFSKIRNNPNYKPTKATAIAFAIALELDLEATKDLIGRAGYALTRSSKFDLIIMYFIAQGNYNMFDINAALFEFDQSLLGA